MIDRLREPTFDKQAPSVQFDMEEFDTTMIDGFEKEHDAHIKWEGYFYDGSMRIVKLEVKTKYDDLYFEEVVLECLALHLGKRVTLETKIEQVI